MLSARSARFVVGRIPPVTLGKNCKILKKAEMIIHTKSSRNLLKPSIVDYHVPKPQSESGSVDVNTLLPQSRFSARGK